MSSSKETIKATILLCSQILQHRLRRGEFRVLWLPGVFFPRLMFLKEVIQMKTKVELALSNIAQRDNQTDRKDNKVLRVVKHGRYITRQNF